MSESREVDALDRRAEHAVIEVRGLRKAYPAVASGAAEIELFRGLDLTVLRGEMVAIVGQSGAGKSSLLHLLAALDRPTEGTVWVSGQAPGRMNAAEAARFRNRTVGYVWQFHYLMPEFTAAENVAMPLLARGSARGEALREASRWLAETGLAGRERHRAGELSGGEQQRVSLARALVTAPHVLLADEPTGDLDVATADAVFQLLRSLHARHGLTSVIVTHNQEFAARCDRVLTLRAGRLEGLNPISTAGV